MNKGKDLLMELFSDHGLATRKLPLGRIRTELREQFSNNEILIA